MLPLFGGTSPALPQPRLFTASASVPRSSVFGVFLWGGEVSEFLQQTRPPPESLAVGRVCAP